MLSKRKIIIPQLVLIISFLFSCNNSVLADQNFDEHQILQSASELDYPPFSIIKSDGTADGFSVELLKAVVKAVNLEVNISVGPWHKIKQQLSEGHLDVLPLVSYNTDRDKIFDFTAPYLQMHGTIFVRKEENSIHSEADLKDKEVLVMRGDTAHEYAVSTNLTPKLILTTSFEEAMKLLASGKHDAVFCQYLMGLQLIKKLGIANIVSISTKHEDNLKPRDGGESGFEQKFCLAVPEGRKELLARLNEGLAIVNVNGTYEKLYNKWFGPILPPAPVSLKLIIKYLVFTLVPILFIMAVVGVWYLKREIARKTKKLNLEIKEHRLTDEEKEKLIKSLKKALDEIRNAHSELNVMKTALENKNSLLQELSVTDSLTGLYNRGYIDDAIQAEIKRTERYGGSISLIMADIDYFKKFNDSYGHQVGDKVLCNVSELLKKNIRNTDTIGRWGGEEFIVICPNSSEQQCVILAEKLRLIVETTEHDTFGGVTCSFGVSEYVPGNTENEFIKGADMALYESKKSGRNCVTKISDITDKTKEVKIPRITS